MINDFYLQKAKDILLEKEHNYPEYSLDNMKELICNIVEIEELRITKLKNFLWAIIEKDKQGFIRVGLYDEYKEISDFIEDVEKVLKDIK